MKITTIRMNRLENSDENKLKAWADITLDNNIAIHGIKIINGENGLFVAMPSKRVKKGEDDKYKYIDTAHILDKDLRESVIKEILDFYKEDGREKTIDGQADETTISRITMRKNTKEEDKVKAWVSISLSDSIVIYGIRLFEGTKGLFAIMPSKKTKTKKHVDVVHAINNPTREKIQKAIIEKYNEEA